MPSGVRARVNATQLVLGASRRGQLAQLLSHGVGVTTAAESAPSTSTSSPMRKSLSGGACRDPLPAVTRPAGCRFILAVLGLPLLTGLLLAVQPQTSLPTDILAFLVTVVAVALVGGLAPALFAAVAGSCCSIGGSPRPSTSSPSPTARTSWR